MNQNSDSEGHAPPGTRDALRAATRHIHERLHQLSVFRRLLEQTITRDGYRALLARLYGFHKPIETALLANAAVLSDLHMAERRRCHFLAEDLATLGLLATEIDALPLAPVVSGLDNPARFLGCLYVREGAMLGGRAMAAKLNYILGPGLAGRRFFTGTVRDLEHWRACCAALELPNASALQDSIVTAALDTFESFEVWINELETLKIESAGTITAGTLS